MEDLFTGICTDLITCSYTFQHMAGNRENRFLLHFDKASPEEVLVSIYASGKTVYVATPSGAAGEVRILNMLGHEIVKGRIAAALTRFIVDQPGIYVVQVVSDGKAFTDKVVIL